MYINVREYQRGNKKMDNQENLATHVTQNEEKQNKNTAQYMLDTTMHKQNQIMSIKHDPSYKQLEV
jgi:hypothetical protein